MAKKKAKKAGAKEAAPEIPLVPAETDPSLKRPETVTVIDPKTGALTKEISTKPTDLGDYKGKYKHASYKEPFGLKIVQDDTHGRTHILKNTDYTWSGTEDEFKQQFDKQ